MARYDEFDDESSYFERVKQRLGARHFAGLAILLIIAVGAFAFGGMGSQSDKTVALIKADQTPYKIPPEDIGGMAVPNQNSTIFETLNGQAGERPVENLLADTEEPMTKADITKPEPETQTQTQTVSESEAETKTEIATETETAMVDATADTSKPESMPAHPETGDIANTEPSAAPFALPVDDKDVVAVTKEEPAVVKAPEVKTPDVKIEQDTAGNKSLQFAAVKSDAEARALWAKLQAKNPELSGYTLRVERADLQDKGIFYRVKVAGLSDSSAQSLCGKIKARGGSCMVVK